MALSKKTEQLNFAAFFEEVIIEKAKELNEDTKTVRLRLYATAYDAAAKGDFSFYKDIMDRVHGKVTDKTEHSGRVAIEQITGMVIADDDDATPLYNQNSQTAPSGDGVV